MDADQLETRLREIRHVAAMLETAWGDLWDLHDRGDRLLADRLDEDQVKGLGAKLAAARQDLYDLERQAGNEWARDKADAEHGGRD